MNGANHTLTIIVPVYNEEDNLGRVGEALSAYLRTRTEATVLFVNDGSTDRSAELIEALCAANPRFRFLHLQRNDGLSTALKAGLDHVVAPYAGYIDSDLQTSPEDFDALMAFAADHDLVTGVRVNRRDGLVKNASSRIANAIRRSITHDGSRTRAARSRSSGRMSRAGSRSSRCTASCRRSSSCRAAA
jgi:glycosyltransferase involved in cell wall biosynthesis